ncbi:MAG: hypothetical protein ABSH46_11015 [Bryobacteraceae bacterium]|jgi:hypothetical protein
MPVSLILASGPGTAWLNLTNGALGLAVLLCCGLIMGSAVYEFTARARGRAHIMRHADAAVHALLHGREDAKG